MASDAGVERLARAAVIAAIIRHAGGEGLPAAAYLSVVRAVGPDAERALAHARTLVGEARYIEARRERDEARERAEAATREWVAMRDTASSFQRERDEARAERDNISVEAHHWMAEAARCRKAVERFLAADRHRIGTDFDAPVALEWDQAVDDLRALGGGDE